MRDERNERGQFAPGNQMQLRYGGTTPAAKPRSSPPERSIPAMRSGLGGEQTLTAPILALVVRAVEADAIAETAIDYLRKRGSSLTGAREQKAIATFFTAVDRLHRVESALAKSGTSFCRRSSPSVVVG